MNGVKEHLIKLWILYCFFVFTITETLSFFNLINRYILLGIYVLGLILLLYLYRKKIRKIKLKPPKYWKWYLLLFFTVFLPLLLIALYYPPNNWDSMTYHLSRIEHWIQNKNVEFYPTNINRQLLSPPFAEYIMLHWRLLAGNDYFVNLVQYVSMTLSVLLSTLIVKEWKGRKLAELLAAVLVATVPMGIMQATSTQNDYVTTFFVLSTFYFCLKNDLLYVALSVGLGFLTKDTYAIFAFPFCLYWVIGRLMANRKTGVKIIMFILISIFAINFFHWKRNYNYFGSILGPKVMVSGMTNQNASPKYVISNIVRNISSQIGLPNSKYNQSIFNAVVQIHNKLGISVNDQNTTWFSDTYSMFFGIHEDRSGNFLLLTLICITGCILLFKKNPFWREYTLLLTGWLLFNLLIKWSPWQARLPLPFFVSMCPLIAITLTRCVKNKSAIHILMVFIILISIPFILGYLPFDKNNPNVISSIRPLTRDVICFEKTRYERFLEENSINTSYNGLVKAAKKMGVKNIGLNIGMDSSEYPLWVAIRQEGTPINVNYVESSDIFSGRNFNSSQKYDVIVSDNSDGSLHYKQKNIKETLHFGSLEMTVLK